MTPAAAQSISFDASPGADHSLVIEKTNFPRIVRSRGLAICEAWSCTVSMH